MITFSFIICSHRAPKSLYQTLDSLASQEGLESVEVILVNNGFDRHRESQLMQRLQRVVRTIVVQEPIPGLGPARRSGFIAARGYYFILLDDDNYLGPGFLRGLQEIVNEFPDIGGVCPLVEPVWEKEPSSWLQDFGRYCLSYNASGNFRPEFKEKLWSSDELCLRPPGGGMIINRKVAHHYLDSVKDPRRIALARSPDSLVGCEDEDIYSGVFELGLASFFSCRLKVFHIIPAFRTQFSYLVKLNFQMLYSFGILQRMRGKNKITVSKAILEMSYNMIYISACILTGRIHVKRGILEIIRKAGLLRGLRYGSA